MSQREIVTIITRKGQTTIPIEIRRALGLKEGDKISFVLDGNQARLERAGSIVARTAGMLKSEQPRLTAKELRRVAEQAIADETGER